MEYSYSHIAAFVCVPRVAVVPWKMRFRFPAPHQCIENGNNPVVDSSNRPQTSTTAHSDTATISNENSSSKHDVTVLNPGKIDGENKSTTATPVPPNATTTSANTKNNQKPKNETSEENEDDHDYDHSYYPTIDPDEERERVHRVMNCCSSCCIIMVLCLIIAKLEQSYSTDANDENEGSFNTMWILFPLFLISGCIILMFTCCICLPSIPLSDPSEDIVGNETTTNTDVNGTSTTTTTLPCKTSTGIVPPSLSSKNDDNNNKINHCTDNVMSALPLFSIALTSA